MAWQESGRSNESSLLSLDSPSSRQEADEDELDETESSASPSSSDIPKALLTKVDTRHFSFAQHQGDSSSKNEPNTSAASAAADAEGPSTSHNVPAEQERQLLLLMLLAQVCALHDPTPRTFTVHVLELFERGILDRQSIVFLFELGLVPSLSPSKLQLPSSSTDAVEDEAERDMALARTGSYPSNLIYGQRTVEASAIRVSLEQQEKRSFHKSHSEPAKSERPTSWSAENHPLSLSRYQREFVQIRQLSAGAFGQVFHATSNMDGRDYAVKRIPFSATGYSRESVQQVVREVHCLAMCDHVNVVRYYTSWLEPSWMTGSGTSSMVDTDRHPMLLKDAKETSNSDASDDESSASEESKSNRLFRRWSFDSSNRSWSINHSKKDYNNSHLLSRDDSDIFDRSDTYSINQKQSAATRQRRDKQESYRYQICLFIQMQLCHSSTLADWIRERNNSSLYPRICDRIGPVLEIFRQLARGLDHVHRKNIIHRDLKPANVFATVDGELQFKIGDFGLSKKLGPLSSSSGGHGGLSLSSSQEWEERSRTNPQPCHSPFSLDPLTAGVGTASYASPEQASSKVYGKETDIFSLGLILLEMVCCFGTEHERYQVFQDCRCRRIVPKEIHEEVPSLARVILSCTEPKASMRPSAEHLISFNIDHPRDLTSHSDIKLDRDDELKALRQLLVDKDSKISALEKEIRDKDHVIADLRSENGRLQRLRAVGGVFTYPTSDTIVHDDECLSSSSSEEAM